VRNYPPTLRDAGMGGTVVIWFFVDEHGRVARLQLSRTSGICELDVAGMNIASIMRFSPAGLNDTPVAVWVEIPIVFTAR
jgi:periplasmic protein TonB